MFMKVHWIWLAALLVVVLPCGAGGPKKSKAKESSSELERYVVEAEARGAQSPAAAPGSLWTPDSRFSTLGMDPRAARVDDMVTIVVVESASAVASGTVKTARSSSLNASVTGLAKKTNPAGALANLAGLTGGSSIDGQGSTSRETTITTTLTGRVTRVLPNGYLLVEGRKVVGVNAEEQVVSIRGIVRTVDLAQDNSVTSDRMAQMEVSVNGKGVVGSTVRRPMFLYRLLMGLLPL